MKETREIERYIVDCESGEIVSEEVIEDWIDNIPDDGGRFGNHKGDDKDHGNHDSIPDDEDIPSSEGDHPDRPHEGGENEPPFEH